MRSRDSTTASSSLLLILALSLQASTALADLGRTYEIAEPDTLSEIEQRASRIDWEKKWRSIDVRKKIREGSVRLPYAKKDEQYTLDLRYELEVDVPDDKGNVLYPKGYKFNPVRYVKLPYKLGVISDRPVEIEWARKQEGPIVWMTSGGDPVTLTEKLGVPVYLYTPRVSQRFNLKAVPVLIEQQGEHLVARQYYLSPEGGDNQ